MTLPYVPPEIFDDLKILGVIPKDKKITPHYHKKAVRVLMQYPDVLEALARPHQILQPARPDIWEAGGFFRVGDFIIAKNYKIKNYFLFSDPDYEFYQAEIFYGGFYGQFIKASELVDYLEELQEHEQWYDQIAIRTGDNAWFGMASDNSRGVLYDDATLLSNMIQGQGNSGKYARSFGAYGATDGTGYVQLIYIVHGRS